nr:MAG TPA: hypothetical protein [Caudoviricetes sp.]
MAQGTAESLSCGDGEILSADRIPQKYFRNRRKDALPGGKSVRGDSAHRKPGFHRFG